MKWILFILIFQSSLSFSENLIKGEGKFLSTTADSHEFVKRQLIFEGIKDMITKELSHLNLNQELFWQKYNEELSKKLDDIEASYKILKKFDEETNLERKKMLMENIRVKKLDYSRRFLSLNKLLSKFAIKKLSRSQQNPLNRYIQLEGEIRSKELTKIYYNLVRGKQVSEYGSLYVRPVFNLQGTTYAELGIDNEKELKGEVSKNWLEWLIQNKPLNIANVEILSVDKEENLDNLLKLPLNEYASHIPEYFVNSLILEMEINIVKEKYDPLLKESIFIYSGSAFVKDIQTNLIVGIFQFEESQKNYRFAPKVNLANVVANHVYQMAKSSFPMIKKSISGMSPVSKTQSLSFEKFDSINQVHHFLNLAEERGVKYSLKAKLDFFTQDKASAILNFEGEPSDIKEFLSTLQAAKTDLSFDIIDTDDQIGIKFNKVIESI